MTNEEQNWHTFNSKLNSFLIDKGYKMVCFNNGHCRQYCLGNVANFCIYDDYQEISFTKDLYSRWYSMGFNEDAEYKPDFKLLAKCADEILTQYKHQVLVNKLLKAQDDF